MINKFGISDYAKLAQEFPKIRFIFAHMGGLRVLDFMLVAKRLPNVYMDLSYTLLYFRGSSVTKDLLYSVKSMRGNKIFYGSDYPDRELGESLKLSLSEFRSYGLGENLIEKVFYKNAKAFYGWDQ